LRMVLGAAQRDRGPRHGHRTTAWRSTGGRAGPRKPVGRGGDRPGRSGGAARNLLARFEPAWPGSDRGHGPLRASRGLTHVVTLTLRVLMRFGVLVRRGQEQGGEKLTGFDPGQAVPRAAGPHAAFRVPAPHRENRAGLWTRPDL